MAIGPVNYLLRAFPYLATHKQDNDSALKFNSDTSNNSLGKPVSTEGPLRQDTFNGIDPNTLVTSIPNGHNMRLQEEQQIKQICEKCRDAAKRLINHPIMDSIKVHSSQDGRNLKMLGYELSMFLGLVESKVPELKYDQTGWDGNSLGSYVDEMKAPQFVCVDEARFSIEALKQLQSNGYPNDYIFDEVKISAKGNHTAIGMYGKNDKEREDPLIILDPWMSEPTKGSEVFFSSNDKSVRENWETGVRTFSIKEKSEKKEFNTSYKYKDSQEGGDEDDYIFFKYFTGPNLRFAITLHAFDDMKERMATLLSRDGVITDDEKQSLLGLDIENKTPDEAKEIWKLFESYLKTYYKTMYPDSELVQKRFGK